MPGTIIIVDGDPQSGQVLAMLHVLEIPSHISIHFIPSNYPNLSYQRYLGWLAAKELPVKHLLYLDDDLRLYQHNAVEKLIDKLEMDSRSAGATCEIIMGEVGEEYSSHPALVEHLKKNKRLLFLVDRFGAARSTQPGGLTPAGNRIPPAPSSTFSPIQWLRGGVMLFRSDALKEDCFSEDLFALYHIRCGKGEDTYLSRQVMKYGQMIYVQDVQVEHPNNDLPKTYPITAYKFAYATAYSRRFLNDHYRINSPPNILDRLELIKTYLGNNFLNFTRAFLHPRQHRFSYAAGYFLGSLRGLVQKPTARNLTPNINWKEAAAEALGKQQVIHIDSSIESTS